MLIFLNNIHYNINKYIKNKLIQIYKKILANLPTQMPRIFQNILNWAHTAIFQDNQVKVSVIKEQWNLST